MPKICDPSDQNLCTPSGAKKSEKVNSYNNTLKEEKKKKGKRNPTCTYSLSLTLSFSDSSVQRARARLLWSLFSALLCFLLSSHRNDAFKELRELK